MTFLDQVEQFLRDYPEISASQFGVLFRKDPNFVGELKKGRSPRVATVERKRRTRRHEPRLDELVYRARKRTRIDGRPL